MTINPLLLEIAASLVAAGILGLVAGWMIRHATFRSTLERRRAHDLQLLAEAALERQTEIDDLLARIAAGEAEREDLQRANRSLEDALQQIEHDAVRRRGVATERRLLAYHTVPAAGGSPNLSDWPDTTADRTPLPERRPDEPVEYTAVDDTIMLYDETVLLTDDTVLLPGSGDDDVTLALGDLSEAAAAGGPVRTMPATLTTDPEGEPEADPVGGFVRRGAPASNAGTVPAGDNR